VANAEADPSHQPSTEIDGSCGIRISDNTAM